jgi:hypothetical protein
LKRSNQLVFTTLASSGVGIGTVLGSTWRAQASELRASSTRPWRASQRGDSGTHRRTSSTTIAGSTPIANSRRH